MILARRREAPGEGGRARSRGHAHPQPSRALDGATRPGPGGFGDAQKRRLRGAPPPALARGLTKLREIH